MDPGPAILWGVILILNLFTLSTENKVLDYSLWGIWLKFQGCWTHIDLKDIFLLGSLILSLEYLPVQFTSRLMVGKVCILFSC